MKVEIFLSFSFSEWKEIDPLWWGKAFGVSNGLVLEKVETMQYHEVKMLDQLREKASFERGRLSTNDWLWETKADIKVFGNWRV